MIRVTVWSRRVIMRLNIAGDETAKAAFVLARHLGAS